MPARNTINVLVVSLSLLAACSSGEAPSGASSATGSTAMPTGPTATSSPSPSEVEDPLASIEVEVDGRVLWGECSGEAEDGETTVALDAGLGNTGSHLALISTEVQAFTRVCTYSRAGLGSSDPAAGSRSLDDLVEDLHAFLDVGDVPGPYVLVGQSLGGSVVLRFAQAHPEEVAGVVSMNPVLPYSDWIERAAKVETKDELQTYEIGFYEGANDESVDLRDTDALLEVPFPVEIPYVVMYAEDCAGEFCDRIRPVLEAATADLADLNELGTFISVKGAGHEIFGTHLDDVVAEIEALTEA